MKISDLDKQQEIIELRAYFVAAPVVIPLLRGMRDLAVSKLVAKQRDGQSDFTGIVAELLVIENLKMKFEQNYRTYQTMEEKNGKPK